VGGDASVGELETHLDVHLIARDLGARGGSPSNLARVKVDGKSGLWRRGMRSHEVHPSSGAPVPGICGLLDFDVLGERVSRSNVEHLVPLGTDDVERAACSTARV